MEEEIRLIIMKLKVTKIKAPGRFDNPSLPIVHFSGSSRSLDASWDPNANSRIRGPPPPPHSSSRPSYAN